VRDESGLDAEDEPSLVARIRAGDRAAFERLYRVSHPRLSRFLANLLRRPHLVEEVLNDTMMVVWTRVDSFAGQSRLSTWIFGIAYRQAMAALRRLDEPMEDHDDGQDDAGDGPEETAGRDRIRRSLADAVARLSPAHRAVIDLTYQQQFGYREIAAILDCPVDTVKTRMFHARRQLRQALPGDAADWL
jgi:RNA polymerase sigma-70 factor (ECF subfamily)